MSAIAIFLKKLWLLFYAAGTRKNVRLAVLAVEAVKAAMESRPVKAFVEATPSDWDDRTVERVTDALSWALKLIYSLQGRPEESGMTHALNAQLHDKPPALRHAEYAKLASLVFQRLEHADGRERRESQADELIQSFYALKKA